jgi:hypothetical protein
MNRTRTRNVQEFPAIAREYVDDIKKIRTKLREKRDDYTKAKKNKDTVKMNLAEAEFIEVAHTWPYFTMIGNTVQVDRVRQPYITNPPLNAAPFPPDGVLMKTTAAERWKIVATALLIRRRLDKRKLFEGLLNKFNASDGINDFKKTVKKYVNPPTYERPPSYPRSSSEEEYEDAAGFEVNPVERVRYNRLTREAPPDEAYIRTPDIEVEIEGTGTLPVYEENYELRGGKTRKHKHSKHKHSKHKHSKHKHSKHKHSKHKKHRKTRK